jgi:hypothetical protein
MSGSTGARNMMEVMPVTTSTITRIPYNSLRRMKAIIGLLFLQQFFDI